MSGCQNAMLAQKRTPVESACGLRPQAPVYRSELDQKNQRQAVYEHSEQNGRIIPLTGSLAWSPRFEGASVEVLILARMDGIEELREDGYTDRGQCW